MIITNNKKKFKEIKTFNEFLDFINENEKNKIKPFKELKEWFNKNYNNTLGKSKLKYKNIQKEIFGKSIKTILKKEYWLQRGYSEDEAITKIKETQKDRSKKSIEKLKNGEYYIPTQLQYWINKGYSPEEARIKQSERQSTFSLDKLIKKYGKEKGNEIFKNRQVIWQKSYQKTCLEKYGVRYFVLSENFENKISKNHQEIIDFIKENYNGEVIINDRKTIYPLELDIFIPEFNFAIEFDGIYWHSNIDKNYHIEKTEKCEEKDIHLFHIFENEWMNEIKKDIWKSKILYKLNKIKNKISARKCIIKEISKDEELEFLEYNHLQGWVPSKYKLGMFFNNELVSVITLGKNRFKKDEWELLRFATKKYTIVNGAFNKFLNYIKNNLKLDNLVSYGNRRWTFKNNVYNNFEFLEKTKPNYFYIKNNKLYHRMNFQKHKLKKILNNYNENFTETENMLNNGFRIIYDSGNLKYKIF